MKKKLFIYIFVCSIALNIGFISVYGASLLNRNTPVAPPNCPFTQKYTHLYKTLGLNQQQLEAIEPLAENFHTKIQALGALIVEQRNRLVAEMAKENTDQDALDAIHRDIAARQSKVQQLVVSHILEMKEIMTSEQREKFFSVMQHSFQMRTFMNN